MYCFNHPPRVISYYMYLFKFRLSILKLNLNLRVITLNLISKALNVSLFDCDNIRINGQYNLLFLFKWSNTSNRHYTDTGL